ELDQSAVTLVGLRDLVFLLQLPRGKLDDLRLALAKSLRLISHRARIDRFLADAVQAPGLLESLAVVFGAGVDCPHALEHFCARGKRHLRGQGVAATMTTEKRKPAGAGGESRKRGGTKAGKNKNRTGLTPRPQGARRKP